MEKLFEWGKRIWDVNVADNFQSADAGAAHIRISQGEMASIQGVSPCDFLRRIRHFFTNAFILIRQLINLFPNNRLRAFLKRVDLGTQDSA